MSVIFKSTVGFPEDGSWQVVCHMLRTSNQVSRWWLQAGELEKYPNRHTKIFVIVVSGSIQIIGPPLSKKSFPVGRVGKKTASRVVGIFFFFPNFNFLN